MTSTDHATLRDKRATATRDHILGAAFELLVEHPDRPFSHEGIATAAGVGARTVYRHFPTQADLFEALWVQLRQQSGTVFPTAEAEIVPTLGAMFRSFDQNDRLIRAVMESTAGARVRAHGAAEGRAGFDQSLQNATQGRNPVERRQVRAVFQGLHSAPFWQMLRERGGLSGPEAIAAASWAAQALLDTLHREQKTSHHERTTSCIQPNHRRKKRR
jgi:AcrR family transcriptional regulator